jgi:hypothetical protein
MPEEALRIRAERTESRSNADVWSQCAVWRWKFRFDKRRLHLPSLSFPTDRSGDNASRIRPSVDDDRSRWTLVWPRNSHRCRGTPLADPKPTPPLQRLSERNLGAHEVVGLPNFTSRPAQYVVLYRYVDRGWRALTSAHLCLAGGQACIAIRRAEFGEHMTLRVFQNSAAGRIYGRRLKKLMSLETTFARKLAVFHSEAYDAVHTLAPVLAGDEHAFYTHGDNADLQCAWARENGLPPRTSLEDILLAQIEAHRAEVFYNFHLDKYDSRFAKRLPGSVRARIGWHAAPPTGTDWTGYIIINNFPSILAVLSARGLRTAYFAPAHDPALDAYAQNDLRDIDVLFVGGYSQYHTKRVAVLEAVAALAGKHNVVFALSRSRLNRIAETPLGVIGPLRQYRRSGRIRAVAQDPVFGRAYYDLLGRTKIVLNGAIDMAGNDRGNMRCWEALGGRTLLLSDAGNYPPGMVDGKTIRTYRSAMHAIELIEESLADCEARHRIANCGYDIIRTRYSKAAQWDRFQRLVAEHF